MPALLAGLLFLDLDARRHSDDRPPLWRSAWAQNTGALPGLRIASIDLSTSPGAAVLLKPADSKPTWRTSFGAERQTVVKPKLIAGSIDADVVLLQGLTSIRVARALFPARAWRLVISRQLLMSEDPVDPWSRDSVLSIPVTAVAVRYQRGLRITGQAHLQDLASTGDAEVQLESHASAATALRLKTRGHVFWVLSVSLPAGACAPSRGACREPRALEDWRQKKAKSGEAVIVGGTLTNPAPKALPPPPCPGQVIAELPYRPSNQEAPLSILARARYEDPFGCLARGLFDR